MKEKASKAIQLVSELIPNYVVSLHFTPLGFSFSPFLPQPFAFLVLETIDHGHY